MWFNHWPLSDLSFTKIQHLNEKGHRGSQRSEAGRGGQQRLPKCLAAADATGRDPLRVVVGGEGGGGVEKKEFLPSVAAQWV